MAQLWTSSPNFSSTFLLIHAHLPKSCSGVFPVLMVYILSLLFLFLTLVLSLLTVIFSHSWNVASFTFLSPATAVTDHNLMTRFILGIRGHLNRTITVLLHNLLSKTMINILRNFFFYYLYFTPPLSISQLANHNCHICHWKHLKPSA